MCLDTLLSWKAKRMERGELTLCARFNADSRGNGGQKTRITGHEDKGCERTAAEKGWGRGVEKQNDRTAFRH